MNPDTLQIVIIILVAGTVVTAGRVIGAFARRLAAPPPAAGLPTREDTEQLREQVERLTGDVAELQERVDFAERMLAKQRDAGQLKG